MVFENGVKNMQAAAYNGARTVHTLSNSISKQNVLSEQYEKFDPMMGRK